FVQVNGKLPDEDVGISYSDIIGRLDQISEIIEQREVQDILVALEPERRQDLVEVISKVDFPDISLKLLPDFYQLVSGLSKTNQIFGMPLIEISPEPMPLWERTVKRTLDIIVSTIVLIVTFPFLILIGLTVRLDSPGPAIYRQKRVGRNEKPFIIYKFRTMVNDAERQSR